MRRQLALVLILLGVAAPVVAPTPASAIDPFGGVNCLRASDSTVCKRTEGDPLTGKDGVIISATNILAFIAGVAAIIFLVFSGIKYIISGGDPAEIAKAKQSIIYALLGLVFIAIARSVIGFVINKV